MQGAQHHLFLRRGSLQLNVFLKHLEPQRCPGGNHHPAKQERTQLPARLLAALGLAASTSPTHLCEVAALLPSQLLLIQDLHSENLYSSLSSAQRTSEFQVTRTEKADTARRRACPWLPSQHRGEQTQAHDTFEPSWCRCLSDSEILS